MIPEIEAAELMGFDSEAMHCYFKQQPLTSEELEHAIVAVAASDIQGLRYAGSDQYILGRLIELGASDCCDALTPKEKLRPVEYEDSENFVSVCLKKIFKTRS
jgi:hypothetical protein